MRNTRFPFVPALCALVAPAGLLAAQIPHATQVVGWDTNNNAGGGTFVPANALGAPVGGGAANGSADVHSLGAGGWLALGLGVTLVDGPGADFLVAENPFLVGPGRVYGELFFVEVSSNGRDFARFPARSFGGDGSAFAINTIGFVSGLAGQNPVYSNPSNPGIDAQDVVEAGGDAFDLADLSSHPLVRSGAVSLRNITQVRLVDVVSGQSLDERGRAILDPSAGSADVDGLTVIHHAANTGVRGPEVELDIPLDGNFSLTIGDPDGLGDLDPASLRLALYGERVDPAPILQLMSLRNLTPTSFTLELGGPLPPGWMLQLGVSIKDRAGARSGAVRQRPLN